MNKLPNYLDFEYDNSIQVLQEGERRSVQAIEFEMRMAGIGVRRALFDRTYWYT